MSIPKGQDNSMKHGSDPPSQKMGHKTPQNKNDGNLLRGADLPLWYNVPPLNHLGGLKMWQGKIPWLLKLQRPPQEGGRPLPKPKYTLKSGWLASILCNILKFLSIYIFILCFCGVIQEEVEYSIWEASSS
jgi:hypothetical protein